MARSLSPIENQNLAQGLITEASPLTFPPNASVDELNFEVRRDLSRARRLGMAAEQGYQVIDSGYAPQAEEGATFSSFNWENVGGISEKRIGVIQVGGIIKFLDILQAPISANVIHTVDLTSAVDRVFSYTNVDGKLIVTSGSKNFHIFSYENGTIVHKTDFLKTRDLFGVEDIFEGRDLTSGDGINFRPTSLTNAHRYNLRNQSFGMKVARWNDFRQSTWSFDEEGQHVETITWVPGVQDPILSFHQESKSTIFPSNADAVTSKLYPKTTAPDPLIDRFHAEALIKTPDGFAPAAKGFFIIDAMERGASRYSQYQALIGREELEYPLTDTLPLDRTPGGASVVGEFAGRVWFGGFSGEVEGADSKSPRLSSYVFFSTLVRDPTDISKCYQIGDPTSREDSDLLATDGGFIRLDGAYGICGLYSLGDGLVVLAANGIWRIRGGDSGFQSTDYLVEKVSTDGCSSPNTIVVAEGSLFFWGTDGIYLLNRNEFGDYQVNSVSQGTIQSFFEDIPFNQKRFCIGSYDSFDRKVRWLYNNLLGTEVTKELVYDLRTGGFTPNEYITLTGNRPVPVCTLKVPPFRSGVSKKDVVVGVDPVIVGDDGVTVSEGILIDGLRENMYVILTEDSAEGNLQYTLGSLNDSTFRDWVFFDGFGTDAEAFMVTGYLTGEDTQRFKGVVSLTVHLERTETGFQLNEFGDIEPLNESSCIVQSQWDWTNSAKAGKWGREQQMYRNRRYYIPSGVNDTYDTGRLLVSTTNRLRGRGRALSFLIKTEPGKDCRFVGWAAIMGVESRA